MTRKASSAAPTGDALAKTVRIGQLMDLYGGLLTERQRTFVQLHYEEDLSFGEIARSHGVSRQAIHDAVKHGEAALEDYEAKLQLLARGTTRTAAAAGPAGAESDGADEDEAASDAPPPRLSKATGGELTRLADRLRELHERLQRSGGIIYNGDAVAREVGAIAEEMNRLASDNS